MPRCLPILTPFLDRFFIAFYLHLRPPEPSKSLFFRRKNKVFSKKRSSKLASMFDRFWCKHASIFLPKIHQNPSKNRSQDASIFRSIFALIFLRFWRPTLSHVGHFFAQNTAALFKGRGVYVGSIFFFGFWGVLAPSWRPLGSIWEGSGLHFGGFWYPFSSQFPSFLHPFFQQP